MTATEARTIIQAVVEGHATHNTFVSIWNEVKDRDSEPVFPFVAWDQWRSNLVEDVNGFIVRVLTVRLAIITSVATDRTPAQRDAAVEAADNAAADYILALRASPYQWELSNISTSTFYDEKTQLDTGVVLTFTVTTGALCLDPQSFPPPDDCPTFAELMAPLTWAEIKSPMSPSQLAEAEADLGGDVECADANYQLKDSEGTNIGSAGTIASGGSANITAPDATAVLKDSAGATLSTTAIPSNTSDDITAPDATAVVRNSVPTTLSTTAIKSGASQNIAVADSTITKPDGTTTALPATVALDVRDYRSGIVYNFGRILWSGQTTSYRTGDEGYLRTNNYFAYTRPVYPLRYAELSSWDTLSGNNVWGNTLRFTDRTGAAAATSGNRVIQDHFTGLEWYIPSSLPSDTTWNNAIDAAMASTVESSSDWRLPNDRMLDTLTRDDTAVPLNYSPFNLSPGGNGSLWTSTTDPWDTTQARRCIVNGGGGLFGRVAKSGNNGSYIYCRKFL